MSFTTQQSDGFPDVVARKRSGDKFKIPNGESVQVIQEMDHHLWLIEWNGSKGTVQKSNLLLAVPTKVIAANPNKKFKEVFLWREGSKVGVSNGVELQCEGVEIKRGGVFFNVLHEGLGFSVKADNIQMGADFGDTAPVVPVTKAAPAADAVAEEPALTAASPDDAAAPAAAAPAEPALVVEDPTVPGDIFVSTQISKSTEKVLQRIAGSRLVKASMPPFNHRGKGKLDPAVEQVDAPAFGTRVSVAIVQLFNIDGMADLSAKLQIGVPDFQLNRLIQRKLQEAVRGFKKQAERALADRWEPWLAANADAFARLEEFCSEVAKLAPGADCCKSLASWNEFVCQYADKSWKDCLHVNDVLLNFGFREEDVTELVGVLSTTAEGTADRLRKEIAWFSKGLGCYGLVGSLSDPVNLAFAMNGVPTPSGRFISEDEILANLGRLKTELEKLSASEPTSLWIPSVLVHDCEMDDMLAWLILAYAHHKRGTTLEVYSQLPQGENAEERIKVDMLQEKLAHYCRQVYRDPDAKNTSAVLNYFTAKTAIIEEPKAAAAAPPSMVLEYEAEFTEGFVRGHFQKDRDAPIITRIELIKYEQTHSLLHTISSFCLLLEHRLVSPAFQPQSEKTGSFATDDALKKLLRGKLDCRAFTDKFKLNGDTLCNGRVILAWHGCRASIVESIKETGFAAFGDLDAGYFGHGIYTALESTYASFYARGMFDPEHGHEYANEKDECAVILCACLAGFVYPITPCKEDIPNLSKKGSPEGCKWYGKPLKSRYQSHLCAVDEDSNFCCTKPVDADYKAGQYHELILKESSQLLPLAVVWIKKS